MFYIVIIIMLFLLIFIPLPIKISLSYINKEFAFKIYNIKIDIKKIKTKSQKKEKAKHKKRRRLPVTDILNTLIQNKFKPSIKSRIHIMYGFDDAALTGITYGIFNIVCTFIFQVLNLVMNVKNFNMNIEPCFNKKIFDVKFDCIIFISLANVIYIMIKFIYINHCEQNKHCFST